MDSRKASETTDLKNFMLSLRSGDLLKLIESNQIHIQEKYNALCIKVKQGEEELTRQLLILQQNSYLIEKFQNQLQELSNQNCELLEKQQSVKEENENLKNQLQCSEDKFAQLDIVYDQQVTSLSERIQDLEKQNAELKTIQSQDINQFDQTQTELTDKLTRSEQLNADLERKLTDLTEQQENEKRRLQLDADKVNELNITLTNKVSQYEESIKNLQRSLLEALNDNKQISELKNKIDELQKDRDAKAQEFQNEKTRLIAVSNDFKSLVEDLKKKLSAKEREAEEAYIKCKQLSKFVTTMPDRTSSIQSKYSTRKRSSTDDPKPLDNTSDSDNSSISFYKPRKARKISVETDDDNMFDVFPSNMDKKPKPLVAFNQKTIPKDVVTRKRSSYPAFQQHVEVPESPVVSSSAFSNLEQK